MNPPSTENDDDAGEDSVSDRKKAPGCSLYPTNRARYDQAFPFFSKPRVIGSFSLGLGRKTCRDRGQLKFYHNGLFRDPKSPSNAYRKFRLDLNDGVEAAIRKDSGSGDASKGEKLDKVLEWILDNREAFRKGRPRGAGESFLQDGPGPKRCNDEPQCLSTDFVCFRGLLTKIMCSPFESIEDWEIVATRFRKTIYLYAVETDLRRQAVAKETPRQKAMSSWGYKFEQYILSDRFDGADRRDSAPKSPSGADEDDKDDCYVGKGFDDLGPVHEEEEFCCIFRSTLGNHSIVYGAEMDGFQLTSSPPHSSQKGVSGGTDDEENSKRRDLLDLNRDGEFVELKTSRKLDNRRLVENFHRFKTLKWWAQCFLASIPKVICGFRDDNGLVKKLEDFEIAKLPKLTRFWAPNICMNFLKAFLDETRRIVNQRQQDLVTFRFYFHPKEHCITVREDEHGSQDLLPDWYLSSIFAEVPESPPAKRRRCHDENDGVESSAPE